MQASEFSKTTRDLVNGINRNPLDREPGGRADLEASKHGKSDEDSAHDHFNELQSLHGDTVRTYTTQATWSGVRRRAPDPHDTEYIVICVDRRPGGALSPSCYSLPGTASAHPPVDRAQP